MIASDHGHLPKCEWDEALEEAAIVAERYDSTGWDAVQVKNAIAYCIRALKSDRTPLAYPPPDIREMIDHAGASLNRFYAVVEAATDLCENIRTHGVHDNWKQLAHALDEIAKAEGRTA